MQYADCEAISEVPSSRKAVAPLVASAAWSLGDMKKMAQAVELLQGPEKTWYSAVLAVMSADQHKALDFIQETRDILSEELGKRLATQHSAGCTTVVMFLPLRSLLLIQCYGAFPVKIGRTRTGRGYDILTRAQLLTELEEVLVWRQCRAALTGNGNAETTSVLTSPRGLTRYSSPISQNHLSVRREIPAPHS